MYALVTWGSRYGLQVFEGESIFHYPQAPSANVEVPLALKRDAAVTIMIKVRSNNNCVRHSQHGCC